MEVLSAIKRLSPVTPANADSQDAHIDRRSKASKMQPHAQLTLIEPSRGDVLLDLKEVWGYRGLLYFLIWRDVKVRYKQTAIGAAWAIIQPVVTMLIFTLMFTRIVLMPTDGLPYPIFVYTALLPWNLFAGAVTRSSESLISQGRLITKVYFPRLIVPLAATAVGIVDFALAFIILIGMMGWYSIAPSWNLLALPLFLLLAVLAASAFGLWFSALNVRYRDVGHALPFVIQVWFFVSPVAYPTSTVPRDWRLLYSLNPMASVVEGFRWALLGGPAPNLSALAFSALLVGVLLFGGLVFFRRMERTFADVV